MASGTETIEPTPDTRTRAASAVQRLMSLLQKHIGEKGFYGEISVKVRFQDGQINHLTVDCSEVVK